MTTFEEMWAVLDAEIAAAGHVLKLDEDGEVDHFAMSGGYHNGPGCSVCGASWCQHCDSTVEPCDGGVALAARTEAAKERQLADARALLESSGFTVSVA